MRKWLAAAGLLLLSPGAFGALPERAPPLYREGEVLVTYRDGADAVSARNLKARLGLVSSLRLLRGRTELLRLPGFATTAAALPVLRADPAVAFARPNFLRRPRALPNDTHFGHLWGLHSTGQANFVVPGDPSLASIPGADMDMIAAWDPDGDGTYDRVGDGSVTIAIIDDSFETSHEDLAANMVPGRNFVPGQDPGNPNPGPGEQHGTFVAGAAGAVGNNGKGVAGTAWNVKLMPLKFDFDTAGHLAALQFARDNGAAIVNASFGGPFYDPDEEASVAALAADGILYVAAAGNDDSNTDFAQLNYPSNFDAPNVLSVAATNRQDNIASFSQYGAITTDVAAPGLQIVTTSNGNGYTLPNCPPACGVTGTSFSAPYTAGIAALIRMVHPGATFGEIKARLIEGAEAAGGVNLRTAGGRVNAANALNIGARPALVIKSVDWVDANRALDPGEILSADITLENLWQDATAVSGTLNADNGVNVTSGSVGFPDIPGGATATARFDLTVDSPITDHRYVHFTLALTATGAGGAYTASRGFIAEIGRLETGMTVTQAFAPRSVDLYDEFHAWHYDFDGVLPAGHDQLVIQTTSSAPGITSPDLDLLVKRNEPPRYNITVGTNPESPGFFCTSGTTPNCLDPAVFMDADFDGHETVAITNPAAGTYHIVVVNFAQLQNGMTYTLRAYTRQTPPPPSGGGGGALPPLALALLALVAARNLRRGA